MRRVVLHIAGIVALAAASTVAADLPANWPRFRGLSRCRRRRSGPPRDLERDREVAWKLGARHRLELAGRVGRPYVRDAPHHTGGRAAEAGAVPRRRTCRPGPPHRWMVYDVGLATGKIRWEREVAPVCPQANTQEIRLGDAGHRRRARLRLLRQRRSVRLRLRTARRSGRRIHRRLEVPQRVGHRAPRRSCTSDRLYHRQRQRRSRSSPRSTSGPARSSGASTRRGRPTGRRRTSGRTSCGPRSSRPARARCAPTIWTARCCGS